jgi:hypothetical protein
MAVSIESVIINGDQASTKQKKNYKKRDYLGVFSTSQKLEKRATS